MPAGGHHGSLAASLGWSSRSAAEARLQLNGEDLGPRITAAAAYPIAYEFRCDREWTHYMYRPIPWQSAPEAWFDPWQSAGGTSGTIHILDHAPPAKQSRTGWPPRSALTFQAVGYKKTASRSEATRGADAPHRHMAGPGRRLQPDSGPAAGNPVWRANVGEASASGIYKGACRRSGKLRTKARCPAPAGFFGLKNRPSGWLQRMIRVVSCAPSSRSLSAACGQDLSPSVNSGAAVTRT
jgi:hypothetical protein